MYVNLDSNSLFVVPFDLGIISSTFLSFLRLLCFGNSDFLFSFLSSNGLTSTSNFCHEKL